MASFGSIYKLTSRTTSKSYIGQTQDTKTKDGKAYKYGVTGRWADHVSSAFRGCKTPLASAIIEHGAEDFSITTLESNIPVERLDEREAHWIATEKTQVPNGYNVMKHSRCKHRIDTTLAEHYLPTTEKVRLTIVKRGGANRIVYLYLDQKDKEPVRLVFGQAADATFEDAMTEAQEFATIFAEHGITVYEEDSKDPLHKYTEKIEQFRGATVQKIRLAKFNHLVALHVKTNEGTTRICFGGKSVSFEDAHKTAMAVKERIMEIAQVTNLLFEDDASRSATGGCL
jgi:group I intron endonuclease